MDDTGKALALSLVRAYLLSSPDHLSYVSPYRKIRFSPHDMKHVEERVGGHWRRKAHSKRSIDALACVCKQPDMSTCDQLAVHSGRILL